MKIYETKLSAAVIYMWTFPQMTQTVVFRFAQLKEILSPRNITLKPSSSIGRFDLKLSKFKRSKNTSSAFFIHCYQKMMSEWQTNPPPV